MSADELLEALQALNPRSLSRARRLVSALRMLREGKSRREVCIVIRQRFGVIQQEAWRVVDMAAEIVDPAGHAEREAPARRPPAAVPPVAQQQWFSQLGHDAPGDGEPKRPDASTGAASSR